MRHTENPKLSLKKKYERLHRQIAWVFCVQMRMGQKKKKNVRVSVSDKDLSEML